MRASPQVGTTPSPTGRDVLRAAVGGQRRYVAAAGALFCSHQAGEALVPVLIGVIIDSSLGDAGAARLTLWLVVLGLVFAQLSFSYRFGARAAERAAEQAAHELRLRLAGRVLDHRGGAEAGRLHGELASTATNDAERVGALCIALPAAVAAATGLTVGGVALLRVSVPLGLLVLLGTPALLLVVNLMGRPLESRSEAQQERAAHAFGIAADLVAGLRVLKGVGAEAAAERRYRTTSRDALAASLGAARARAAYEGAMLATSGCFLALVALVGGRLAAEGDLTVGQLVTAVGLAQFVLGPLEMMAWAGGELAEGRASAKRVAEVLAATPAVRAGPAPLPAEIRGDLRLTGVRFGPLAGLDLHARPGELLAVAAEPADAAALLRCLGRDADPEEGTVTLDGVPLGAYDPGEVRAAVLVAAHDAELFDGTLAENVPGARAAEALVASAADEVAAALPEGAASRVGQGGRALSGGQRQRIALARALAADAPVLVLHDPTTAVDAATEARIATGLRRLRAGRTTLVVTTSPALLAAADRVVLLSGGRAAAEGTHAGLATAGEYRALVLS